MQIKGLKSNCPCWLVAPLIGLILFRNRRWILASNNNVQAKRTRTTAGAWRSLLSLSVTTESAKPGQRNSALFSASESVSRHYRRRLAKRCVGVETPESLSKHCHCCSSDLSIFSRLMCWHVWPFLRKAYQAFPNPTSRKTCCKRSRYQGQVDILL